MADGFFLASHRKSAGITDFKSPLDDVLYAQVDDTLAVTPTGRQRADCSTNFVAASSNAASNKRNDITGIFGGICRHGALDIWLGKCGSPNGIYPIVGTSGFIIIAGDADVLAIADILRGEKFCLPNTMLKLLHERYPRAKVVFFYDIVCRIAPHLQVYSKLSRTLRLLVES